MWIHWIQLLSLFVEGKKIGELLPFVKWGYVYIPTMVEERIKWNYIWQIQKGKMAVWGGLTKSWEKKRSEVKGKGKMERYTHLNAEFQRIASRDKKAFLSDQCKEIKDKIEWERLEISSRKLKIKSIFHAKMGTIKDRNGMELTEGEDIKKSWQEYTEELYKKYLNDPDNHNGVINHPESDILKSEVKWALGSITTNKASGDYRIPAALFQILKDDAVKALHSICQQIWNTQQWPQDWKRSVFIHSFHSNPKERQGQRRFKLPHNCTHLTC